MERVTNQSTVSATVVLDSGILLFMVGDKDAKVQKERQCDVGYFAPTIIVYGDGTEVDRFRLPAGPMGQVVDVVHIDSSGAPKTGEIDVTSDLRRDVLRKSDIKYDHLVNIPSERDFDAVFRFSTGTMRPSSVKVRRFKQMKGNPPTQVSSFPSREIAHDIVLQYDLEPGEALQLNIGSGFRWSTADHPNVAKRFDIEIIADHNTAERYFCDVFGLKGQDHTLPNQGDPPPLGGKP
ncbi:MAG TPA: hypothetical protein VKA70_03690 [Blastocatellia bacterium]|nr:hypothetical protein [Blastocatellia bacterium]